MSSSPPIATSAEVEVLRLRAENAALKHGCLDAGLKLQRFQDDQLAAAELCLGQQFYNGVDVPKLQRLLAQADFQIRNLQSQVEQLRSLPERRDVKELLDDLAKKDAKIAALERELGVR